MKFSFRNYKVMYVSKNIVSFTYNMMDSELTIAI